MKMLAVSVCLETLGVKLQTTKATRMGNILLKANTVENARQLADSVKTIVEEKTKAEVPERRIQILLFDIFAWVEEKETVSSLIHTGIPMGAL